MNDIMDEKALVDFVCYYSLWPWQIALYDIKGLSLMFNTMNDL